MIDISIVAEASLSDAVREHFVAITVQCVEVNECGEPVGDDIIAAYSAFVIGIDGVWCLATAGHVGETKVSADIRGCCVGSGNEF